MDSLSQPVTLRRTTAADPGVAEIIARHFALMQASSSEEGCHVMPADALDREGAHIFAAEVAGQIVGIGAIKSISPQQAEIKSMHTLDSARGKGVARTILRALLEHGRGLGFRSVSLETGSAPVFAPARALYVAEGFEMCPPFADYVEHPESVFMTRQL